MTAAVLLLSACAGTPVTDTRHRTATDIAESMVGKPYRYGGSTPQGFDCSGLVYYSFRHAGMRIPRNTAAQLDSSQRVGISELTRGDLVFFDQDGKRKSHVGIYLGNQRFVHSPSSGKHVRVDSLHDRYWKKHFTDARRF